MNRYIIYAVVIGSIYNVGTNSQVSKECIKCICEAVSGCNATKVCIDGFCGSYRISWPYWSDSGKPTIPGDTPDSEHAFNNCAIDDYCATTTVQGYMALYERDCNGDQKIDCDDYAAIHTLGKFACSRSLPDTYLERYRQCKRNIGEDI